MKNLRSCLSCGVYGFSRVYKPAPRKLDDIFAKRQKVICARRFFTENANHSKSNEWKSTIDDDEVARLSRSGMDWWDANGEFIALHTMNRVRVPYIKKAVIGVQGEMSTSSKPLDGFKMLDVGCGGGLLAEPLARLGAKVTGIDASARNTHVAMRHASLDPSLAGNLQYRCTTVEQLAQEKKVFDCAVSSEVIEHVTEKESFIGAISQLLKPRGSLILTTMNRTPQAYVLAIVAAEYIAHAVPIGTHDWNKFPKISELTELLQENGLETEDIQGLAFNPVTSRWSYCEGTDINFALHAIKI
ncbi:ubiquinone biosynthesis O-methyltransferase isoform X1 [Nematostella vectensis]|uniref:ubiquinone biosynthesis O-methyltransferase isoform X1 n=1 Tax=Nematostella vectensis TaxID=45351 RepID=UPI002077201A|nr:ubiquinone biosynthesis O-methyltransferase isoform X1 [Nematostella vectensis]